MNRIFSVICFCNATYFASAQTISDTLVLIKPVDIISSRFQNNSASHIQKIDSLTKAEYQTSDLSTLLNEQSGIFIKSYGQGSTATSSARGGGASHTTVLWNGFAITNPMLGLNDLSLIPVNFFNQITIHYGNPCALAGSGAIGSAIELNNQPEFNSGIKTSVLFSTASFENYKEQIQTIYSFGKSSTSVSLFNQTAKNNFPFQNSAKYNSPEENQTNNQLHQYGGMMNQSLRFSSRKILSIDGWYQNSHRQIPPTMTTDMSKAYQDDKLFRSAANYQITKTKTILNFRAGWFDESIRYVDSLINLNSYGNAKTFLAEAEVQNSITTNQKISAGINNTYTTAFADEYKQNRFQNKLTAFVTYSIKNKKENISGNMSLRNELINKQFSPPTFQISSEWKTTKSISLYASLAKVYRSPSLNDLYWIPGGNKDLKPENGFTEEAGLNWKLVPIAIGIRNWKLEISSTVFNQTITNWIIWLPGNGGYWTPQNIYTVWARGNETSLSCESKIQNIFIKPSLNFNYTLSSNESLLAGETIRHKQLIYVPQVTASGGIYILYKQTAVSYSHSYKGKRFTTTDNIYFLQPYQYSKLYISQTFLMNKHQINFSLTLNNLSDESYQSIAFRPMPGRNYDLTIQYQFTKLKSHN
jgi:iron complex outermembrane receptor protein